MPCTRAIGFEAAGLLAAAVAAAPAGARSGNGDVFYGRRRW